MVKASGDRIRQKLARTLTDIIDIGNDLVAVKDSLPHGQFGVWLGAEFGWTECTARNFMGVAERLNVKTEMISDLHIAPTAAYLLAAPSTPQIARQAAVQRAAAGERITPSIARELVMEAKKALEGKVEPLEVSMEQLSKRLFKVLERYRDQWHYERITELARHLREFADRLDQLQDHRA